MHQTDSTLRIGAYMYVFLEPVTDIKWETNLYRYDILHRNQYSTKKTSIEPYVIVSFCCMILSIANLDYSNIENFDMHLCTCTQIVLAAFSWWLFCAKHVDYVKTKKKYIQEWEEVKRIYGSDQTDSH